MRIHPLCRFPNRSYSQGVGMLFGCAVALCLLLGTWSANSAAVLDYSPPLNQTPFNALSPGVPVTYASRLMVGARDVEITSISFRLDGLPPMPYDFTAYLFLNSGDQPGPLLGSSHRAFPSGELAGQGLTFYDFAFSTLLSLTAGVIYWAGVGTSSAGYPPYIADTSHLEEFSDYGVTPSLSMATSTPLSYPPSGQWTVNAPDMTLVYKLEGSVVPEPALVSLILLSLGALAIRRIRSKKVAAGTAALLCIFGSAHADSLYVSNDGNDTIWRFNPGGVGALFANTGLSPVGLAFDGAANLYVANYNDNTIYKFTTAGVGSLFASSGLSGPTGLAFDGAGNLFVANAGNSTIERFTPNGVGSVFAANGGMNAPVGLAFDSSGNLFVANAGNTSIQKFTPSGNASFFANGGTHGLAFDSIGNLYAANIELNTIYKYTPAGVGSIFVNSGLNRPYGIAFDSAGNLYAANAGDNTIEKFTPEGVASVFADTGLNVPTGIAIVPEPSLSAMFTMSLLALLAVRRRARLPFGSV